MDNLIEQSQNKNSWLIISTSILDKEVSALEDTSIYFPWIPVLKNWLDRIVALKK